MITNLDIEKKANILIKIVGDALEEVMESENTTRYKKAVAEYHRAQVNLFNFYDFLNSVIDNINENTECFDKEFDQIERTKKSQK